ncbi:hypothetical protein niasHT_017885 [Heterodera trifolii]|uniref:Uncharacterized protein n=1 Tax=Heterodera trifolii TaxID=157864 RepID=A0ABD2LGX8_9BILA
MTRSEVRPSSIGKIFRFNTGNWHLAFVGQLVALMIALLPHCRPSKIRTQFSRDQRRPSRRAGCSRRTADEQQRRNLHDTL